MNHVSCKTLRAKALTGADPDLGPKAQQAYNEAGLAIRLSRSIYQRRIELGWSQAELAHRGEALASNSAS